MRLFVLSVLLILLGVAANPADNRKRDNQDKGAKNKQPSRLNIASGVLVSGSGAPIEVRSLKATILDDGHDKQKKVVTIASGTAFISNDGLGTLLNSKLEQRGLENIKISNDHGQVKITGSAKKAVSLPLTIEGPIALTPQGFIRLSTREIKLANLPGLADLLGIKPDKIVGDGSVKGVQAEKDAIIFDPDLLWGLPVHGKVTRLAFNQKGLLLVFGEQKEPPSKRTTTTAARHK